MRHLYPLIALCGLFVSSAQGKIVTESVQYKAGDFACEGFVAYNDAQSGARPGVLVVHDWRGISDFTKKQCERLAELGYVAFAADIYGAGIRPQTPEDCSKEAGKYYSDRALWRVRVNAALAEFSKMKEVDISRIGAIGFCFGGSSALELARSGAPVVGVVSFHGGLASPTPDDAKNIKGKVLALHGAIDPFVPAADVAAFEKEMGDANVDWQLVAYGGCVHSFTNPNAGNDVSKGQAYNADAARRSWEAMRDFFEEVFAPKQVMPGSEGE